ncbi:hypothetical protein HK099_001479 [Clydaea vesicula]|uniref:Calmodulin-lysine N-methyltransferase n=1 Tax=Clydaea vesicula TaxID=447962 RepID=A0AAD5XVZ0_9FUNG|nr:hypothetical protein HK099_001479 [Clydaea vesicula]KAJ3376847.1 hypothetical protein HDU92_008937 [Lobulomyces angularis]
MSENWKLLRQKILNQNLNNSSQYFQCDQYNFKLFNVIKTFRDSKVFLTYSFLANEEFIKLDLSYEQPTFSLTQYKSEFSGFLNTGNIKIWQTEEFLGYFLLKNGFLFKDKVILELGGGNVGLASLMIAATNFPKKVIVTDGNPKSVQSVSDNIEQNKVVFKRNMPVSKQLLWGKEPGFKICETCNFLIVSDCLYQEDMHQSLFDTFDNYLTDETLIIIFSPMRGKSLQNFETKCKENKKFVIKTFLNFDEELFEKNLKFKTDFLSYEENKIWPVVLLLSSNENNLNDFISKSTLNSNKVHC